MKIPCIGFRFVAALLFCLAFSLFPANCPANSAYAAVINVKNYGALGNGSADDTVAINKAIAAAKAGDTIYFPTGNYLHSVHLAFNSLNVSGDGAAKSLITATTAADGALAFSGSKVTIQHVGAECSSSSYSAANLASGIWFNAVKSFTVKAVAVNNLAGNGIAVTNSSLGNISSSTISSFWETGVLIQDSKDVVVTHNTFPITGTALSVNNSHLSSKVLQSIVLDSNNIMSLTGATRLAAINVAGVNLCLISNNSINLNNNGPGNVAPFGGVFVQGDNTPDLGNALNVTVTGNRFNNCTEHGNIYVQANSDGSSAPQVTVRHVMISDNVMKFSNPSLAIFAAGFSYGTKNVTMSDLIISNNDIENVVADQGIYVDNAGDVVITGNTIKQTGFGSIYLGPGNAAACMINSNKLQNSGPNVSSVSPFSHNAVIDLEPAVNGGTFLTSVEIENNFYSGSTVMLDDFIFDGAPAHLLKKDAVSGNKTTTTLPSVVTP